VYVIAELESQVQLYSSFRNGCRYYFGGMSGGVSPYIWAKWNEEVIMFDSFTLADQWRRSLTCGSVLQVISVQAAEHWERLGKNRYVRNN
jgi:hypothetical protein